MTSFKDRDYGQFDAALLQLAREVSRRARQRELNYATFYFEMHLDHLHRSEARSRTNDPLVRSSFVYAMQ